MFFNHYIVLLLFAVVLLLLLLSEVIDCVESYTVRENYRGRLLISRNVGGNCEFGLAVS